MVLIPTYFQYSGLTTAIHDAQEMTKALSFYAPPIQELYDSDVKERAADYKLSLESAYDRTACQWGFQIPEGH